MIDSKFGQLYGVGTQEASTFTFAELTRAIAVLPLGRLKSLKCDSVWLGDDEGADEVLLGALTGAIPQFPTIRLPTFIRLEVLHLSLERGESPGLNLKHIDCLLSSVPRLSELSLELESSVYSLSVRRKLFGHLLKHRWCLLHTLKLKSIACSELELVAFLSRHRDTLRKLHLGDVFLIKHKDFGSSVLNTLWCLGKAMVLLTQTKVHGYWVSESGSFKFTTPERANMLHRLNNYLCNRDTFPFVRQEGWSCQAIGRFSKTNRLAVAGLDPRVWQNDLMFQGLRMHVRLNSPRKSHCDVLTQAQGRAVGTWLHNTELQGWMPMEVRDAIGAILTSIGDDSCGWDKELASWYTLISTAAEVVNEATEEGVQEGEEPETTQYISHLENAVQSKWTALKC